MAQNLDDHYGCKVDRVTQEYDLTNLDARIQRRRENEDASLRDLEEYVNTSVLEAAMKEAGMKVVEGQEENYYRLLRDDEVKDVARQEARTELRRAGVEINKLEDDFVSYQTVRKHLNDCLEISTSKEYEPDLDETRNTFNALRTRVVNVVTRTLNRLRKHDAIAIGEPEVDVSISVRCSDCQRNHTLRELMRNRACECKDVPPEPGTDTGEETVQEPPQEEAEKTQSTTQVASQPTEESTAPETSEESVEEQRQLTLPGASHDGE